MRLVVLLHVVADVRPFSLLSGVSHGLLLTTYVIVVVVVVGDLRKKLLHGDVPLSDVVCGAVSWSRHECFFSFPEQSILLRLMLVDALVFV